MDYLFKQKINLKDVYTERIGEKLVLVFEPEEYLLDLYCYYFKNFNFQTIGCRDLDLIEHLAKKADPHLLVINIQFLKQGDFLNIKQLFPMAKILSIGYNEDGNAIKKAMACGASSHIDRKTTKPMDIIHIAKNLLDF